MENKHHHGPNSEKAEDFYFPNMEDKGHQAIATEKIQNAAANAAATTQNAAKSVAGTAGGVLGGAVQAAGQATGSALKDLGEAVSNLAKSTENTAHGASEHISKTAGVEESSKMETNKQVTTLGSQ